MPLQKELTFNQLLVLPEEDRLRKVYDFVAELIYYSSLPKKQTNELRASLPVEFLDIFSTMLCEGEICNGGFLQVFYNDSRGYIDQAISGYERMGAQRLKRVFVEARTLFRKELSLFDKAKKKSTIQAYVALSEETALKQNALKSRFYEALEEERPDLLRLNYLHKKFPPNKPQERGQIAFIIIGLLLLGSILKLILI